MIKKYNAISSFDTVTQFRIRNALLIMFGIHLILPILIDLRGELLSTAFISMIMIATTLSMKTNQFFVDKFSISQLYKIGLFIHFTLLMGGFLYFINHFYFVVIDSLISILETAILLSYSIKLDVYQAKEFPEDVEAFKIFRNTSMADVILMGLGIVAFITYFFERDTAVYLFIIVNIPISVYLFKNWKFYDKFFEEE